ncbi:MAG: PilZ domain-containing protein [Candidatus Methylomirabilis sp.]|nr:PilZ domain-containing protein [Deltaproteobacteria bacterium]
MLEEKGFTNAVLERRSFYRLPCEIPATLRLEEGGGAVATTIVNLSGRGCAARVGAADEVRPGLGTLSFRLPGVEKGLAYRVRIGSVRLSPGGKLLGLAFEGLGGAEEAALVQFILEAHRKEAAGTA